MDQNTGNGTDKRNWRERLGIGAAEGPKGMPKVADDFKPAPAAPVVAAARPAAAAPVKAAPMAPRPAPRPAAPVPAAPRVAPVPPDALANKLKTQRDAAERLAVQRVQAAKQKAEASLASAAAPANKPKFSFADDEAKAAPQPQQVPQQRPIQTQPPRPAPAPQQTYVPPANPYAGQVQPPRPQLGVNPGYVMPPAYPQGQPYQPAPQQPQQGYQPQYQPQQPPAYRPIDPNTGYAPPPGYNPNMRPQYAPPQAPVQQQPQPRLQVPPRVQQGGYVPNPRLTNPPQRAPQVPMAGDEHFDELFEEAPLRPTRRATAGEYQQAYRNEVAYEDEAPRSGFLGKLLGFGLLGLLVTIGTVLAYSHYLKPQLAASGNGGTVPVIAAPATPTKVVPDKTAAPADQPVKKQIYDRIEGDHEVLGGQVQSTEEPPALPAGSGTNLTPPADPNSVVVDPANNNNGADSVPLPLPPPPGGSTGQQGSLEPSDKADIANVTPAAEQSSAANSSQVATQPGQTQVASAEASAQVIAPPPVPDGKPIVSEPSKLADPGPKEAEVIVAEKPVAAKKVVLAERPARSLGASPVVLVPPSKNAEPTVFAKPKAKTSVAAIRANPPNSDNSIYGSATDAPVEVDVTAQATPKKQKSIFDLFKSGNQTSPNVAAPSAGIDSALAAAPTVASKPLAQVASATPPSSGTGAYVVQLASFKSRSEATSEYQRLGAKHGAIITRYAPIIETAQVAGSTRYRLNLGPMASTGVASSVCSSLFAAGERDCIVHRQ
jgi:SPOR domain